jgi:hypothetical protein
LRNGVARWRSSQDGSDEQMFGEKQQIPPGGSKRLRGKRQ